MNKRKLVQTSILQGFATNTIISLVVLGLCYKPFFLLSEPLYDHRVSSPIGYIDAQELCCYILSGIACFLLLLVAKKVLAKEYGAEVFNAFFFASLMTSAIVVAFGIVICVRDGFSSVGFFFTEILMWMVALLLYFVVSLIRKCFR